MFQERLERRQFGTIYISPLRINGVTEIRSTEGRAHLKIHPHFRTRRRRAGQGRRETRPEPRCGESPCSWRQGWGEFPNGKRPMWPRASGISRRATGFSYQGPWLPQLKSFSGMLKKLWEPVGLKVGVQVRLVVRVRVCWEIKLGSGPPNGAWETS